MLKKIWQSLPQPIWGGISAMIAILIFDKMGWSILDTLRLPAWPTFIGIIIITSALVVFARWKAARQNSEGGHQN
jgi:hypothetical protein